MKKFIVAIIVLVVIYISLLIVKYTSIEKILGENITIEEIVLVETYIEKIYMWQEVTGQALVEFETLSEIDEMWLWTVVGKNIVSEITYQAIEEKAVELFGDEILECKEFPSEGGFNYVYESGDRYYIEGVALDAQNDVFVIDTIEKIGQDRYIVEIIEYLEDYNQSDEENVVYIKNTNREIIGKVNADNLKNEGKELVKQNKEKCEIKQLELRLDLETKNIYVESIRSKSEVF